jgi:hypothetical protein
LGAERAADQLRHSNFLQRPAIRPSVALLNTLWLNVVSQRVVHLIHRVQLTSATAWAFSPRHSLTSIGINQARFNTAVIWLSQAAYRGAAPYALMGIHPAHEIDPQGRQPSTSFPSTPAMCASLPSGYPDPS